jgi:serine/threonine protein kinase
LSDLIDRLLEKDPVKRPSVREILKMELIRRKAKEFLEQNEVKRSKTIVFKKNMPVVVKA